jgi:very-short-patch-repair endonuclease
MSIDAHFDGILAYYRALWPVMKVTPTWQWACGQYEIDWTRYMSPIERMVWGDIREAAVVMYPQHPIAGYFVDFGHPVAKVALECDGKQFHQDKAKDAARQAAIEAKGWTVYRLTGRQCMQWSRQEWDDDTEDLEYQLSPAQELVREIGARHDLCQRRHREAA